MWLPILFLLVIAALIAATAALRFVRTRRAARQAPRTSHRPGNDARDVAGPLLVDTVVTGV